MESPEFIKPSESDQVSLTALISPVKGYAHRTHAQQKGTMTAPLATNAPRLSPLTPGSAQNCPRVNEGLGRRKEQRVWVLKG